MGPFLQRRLSLAEQLGVWGGCPPPPPPYREAETCAHFQGSNFIAAIAAIAVEGEQNAGDHWGNDGNFLPYSAIFILFTVYYYFDT